MNTPDSTSDHVPNDPLTRLVRIFLDSNLSIILIVFSLIVGAAALLITPREEDPQIVVPMADIHVQFPGHSAAEVEQLVSTPLERVLYQIDGVEYVYSMSRENQSIITVRFFVGQDRERSLVKLFKKLDENVDIVPPGVNGWVVKPVEIDDVPVVTLALSGKDQDSHTLRRIGEELVERLSSVSQVSRAAVIGGEPRQVRVTLDTDRLRAHNMSVLAVQRSLQGANVTLSAGDFTRADRVVHVESGLALNRPEQFGDLVVGVARDQPVFLKDVAQISDGAAEVTGYVRHGWGSARGFIEHEGSPATLLGDDRHQAANKPELSETEPSTPAVTIAISKQKGANAVHVANQVLRAAEQFEREVLPDDVQMIVTRNYGLTANEKVNELVEGLAVAIIIVIVLLTLSMGWREALIVSVAVPVVFGLTLAVNLLFGYTINRVTLFALILAIGLLVDDPIVDVENIARHFEDKKRATREIVLQAVAEIRPPLISATLAVIVSFLPMFFITGMMGPYMSPMALNVPVSMLMSMLVAFTITPWLSYHILGRQYKHAEPVAVPASTSLEHHSPEVTPPHPHEAYDPVTVQQTWLYRMFRPLMTPLLKTRWRAFGFLALVALLTLGAMSMAAVRSVPLKMLPFDNKNELLFLLDLDEGTTLERTNAVTLEFERLLSRLPEVTDFTSYIGQPGPIDFNGLVRHYYLREAPHFAEMRVNLVGKKHRIQQSHAITLRLRDEMTQLAQKWGAKLQIVELPPGPPVMSSIVAEVTGRSDQSYEELLSAASLVANRLQAEPGVVEVDDVREFPASKLVFVTDQEKAALAGISVQDIAATIRLALGGDDQELVRVEGERHPLRVVLRLPRESRSSPEDLNQIPIQGRDGNQFPLAEIGHWDTTHVSQTIYHKNLQRIVYVFAECAGRPPAECVMDVQADRNMDSSRPQTDVTPAESSTTSRPLNQRTYFHNGGGDVWNVPAGIDVGFSGEGEWKITLDVFRDLGLAFGAAMLMIYIILVAQTGSFTLPIVVMLAIPLTVLGVMPGFWLLNVMSAQSVGGYSDPVFFTATAMVGMIALAGIVTRDAIILVDFIEMTVRGGRPLFDAILESRVVRLRPILLTAGAALLSAIPITFDPIFSGLGWSLIFGLVASTLFTLFVIPTTYWLLKR
ncbi:MAG: efflux RND transporter permease subunit [Planctomycetaceae bacterium]